MTCEPVVLSSLPLTCLPLQCGVTLVHLEGSHPDDQLLAATAATAALAKAQKQAGGRAAAQGQGEGSSKAVSTSAASTQPLDGLALVQGAQAALLQLLPVPEGQQGGYQTPGSAGRGDAPSALLQDPIAREALLEGLLGPGGLAAGHGHFMQVRLCACAHVHLCLYEDNLQYGGWEAQRKM